MSSLSLNGKVKLVELKSKVILVKLELEQRRADP